MRPVSSVTERRNCVAESSSSPRYLLARDLPPRPPKLGDVASISWTPLSSLCGITVPGPAPNVSFSLYSASCLIIPRGASAWI